MKYPTQQEVLSDLQERIGRGAGSRVAGIARVSRIAGAKWFREGIPRERVGLFRALTGVPAYVIRPDEFVPTLAEIESHSHVQSVPDLPAA